MSRVSRRIACTAVLSALIVAPALADGAPLAKVVGWRRRPIVSGLVRLVSGPGFRVRSRRTAWAAPHVVVRLRQVMSDYRRRFPAAPPVWVHDLSARWGGRLPRHRSHRTGHDADIRLPLRWPSRYVDATPRTLDRKRTWFLILSLAHTCDVEFILLDRRLQRALYHAAVESGVAREQLALVLEYPNRPFGRRANRPGPLVRHFPHHANHLHVRFRAAARPLAMDSVRRLCGAAVHRPPLPASPLQRSLEL